MPTIVPGTFSGNLSTTIGSISANDIVIMQESSVAYTSGLDLSSVELDKFIIAPTCKSDFGSSSAGGVKLDLSGAAHTGLLEYRGSGSKFYCDPETTIARTIIDPASSGMFYGTGGTFSQVEQGAGSSNFNSSSVVGLAYVIEGAMTIDEHVSSTVTTLVIGAKASVVLNRSATTVNVDGRLISQKRDITIGTLSCRSSCNVRWASGDITTVNGNGGVLDLSGISQDVTIGTLNKYTDDFKIIRPSGAFTLTITTENLFAGASTEK